MQEIKDLVSVIIPVFNGEFFLYETLNSVKKQTYNKWEIIVVNDGSTDATARILQKETDSKIRLLDQTNQGVSAARNNGLKNAVGEYVVFLDADDIMTPMFLDMRVSVLKNNQHLGFTGGLVDTFPLKTITKRACADNPANEILFFSANCVTVPSNYMFRRNILIQNNIWFNSNLKSTADRFFILQVAKVTIGKSIDDEKGKLLYRVSPQSMSHHINPGLILDNERFYKELIVHDLLPSEDIKRFNCLYFYSLAIGFLKVRFSISFIKYIIKSFFSSPGQFIRLAGKKIYAAAKI